MIKFRKMGKGPSVYHPLRIFGYNITVMILNPVYIVRKLYHKKRFRKMGKGSSVDHPLRINGYNNIELADNVCVNYKSWLQALPLTGETCLLSIGSGTTIGDFNHIVATKKIVIEENVLTANNVYISDNLHDYQSISVPVKKQNIKQLSCVTIGAGSWIGENACIIGANVGKNCVIGANAVVTKDIPDFSVAVGVPAKIIKRYDSSLEQWVNVEE